MNIGFHCLSSNDGNVILNLWYQSTELSFYMTISHLCCSRMKFCSHFPGPTPDVDVVLSICLQSDIPIAQPGKSGSATTKLPSGPGPSTSDLSGSSRSHPLLSGSSFKPTRGKRKEIDSMFFLSLFLKFVYFTPVPKFPLLLVFIRYNDSIVIILYFLNM